MANFSFNLSATPFKPQSQGSNDSLVKSKVEDILQHMSNRLFDPVSLEYKGWIDYQEHHNSEECADNDISLHTENVPKSRRESKINQIPALYRKLSITIGKWGMDVTNYHRFNRTGFCGLQGCLPNAYCNAMIQALYFQEDIRQCVLCHSCNVDKCLVCELAFLFHMMDQSTGLPCQPANFLRALRTNSEAIALGLVFSDSESQGQANMSAVVQAWNRFMLGQFQVMDAKLAQKSRIQGVQVAKCSICQGCISVESDNDNLCTLTYPKPKVQASFEDILCTSLNSAQSKPSWCGRCRRFQMGNQKRQIQFLPSSLTVNTGLDSDDDGLDFWREQSAQLATDYEEGASNGQSWIPERITLQRLANGKLKGGATELSSEESEEFLEMAQYELHSVCYIVMDPGTGLPLNVVAVVNVGSFYHARVGSPVSQWYLFNDFSIDPISIFEATGNNQHCRVPTSMVYRRVGAKITEAPSKPVLDFDVFNPSRGQGIPETFWPLEADQVPQRGDLVGLDAEMVTLKPEVLVMDESGREQIVKAAQRAVARVTCIRGSGKMIGVPFVDDYISCEEEIFDYVTRYSGIYPGDLDPSTSSKYLTTLKTTYKKIRYLVDAGCIFVGHGLKNDFEALNIVVPMDQVVDTVHLFHLPKRRMLSLQFLAWYFLGKVIQGGNHDSTEDAVTALELYGKYREFEAMNAVPDVLQQLYEDAKLWQWKVPEHSG